ncbi:tetratricopeptide repeat protein [Candidatus Zixiibacteriota bacterium]
MKRTIQMVGATAILVIAVTVHAQQVQAQQIENVEAAEAYNQARTLYQEGNYDEAKELLLKSARLESGNYRAHYLLGLTYQRLRQADDAIAQFEAAVRFNPNYYQVYSAMASVYLNSKNDTEQALVNYIKSGEVSESVGQPYWQAFFNQGKIYFDQLRWDEALQAYSKVAQYQPANETAFLMMGRVQVETGDYENAIMNFTQAATIKPTWMDPYFFQANVLNRLGQYEAAIVAADQALERMPGDGGSLFEKGMALKNQEKWDEAIAVLEQAARDAQWRQNANYQIEVIKNRDKYVDIPPDTGRTIPPVV